MSRASSEGDRAVRLDVRSNSLNLVRLVLAFLVLFAHGFYLSGNGPGPSFRGENLGGWAVFGFFAISGYLVTASRFANPFGRYLVLRMARIYPAFVVCLVVTAGVFAPLAWWAEGVQGMGASGSSGATDWGRFLDMPTSPVAYVLQNLALRITAYDVAGTPASVPYPGAWNGSLWTLFFELCCYLFVGLLICLPVVRRHRWLIGALFVLSVIVWANAATWRLTEVTDLALFARLLPPFLGGAVVQVLVGSRPLRTPVALGCTCVATVAVLGVEGWGAQAASPFIAYALLWLSTVVPSPAVVRRHDISYGAYIYAFPVQQLLVYAGAHRLGLAAYDLLAAAVTAMVATFSWRLVERPILRRVRHPGRASHPGRSGSAAGYDVPAEGAGGFPAAPGHRARQEGEGVRP